MAQISRNSRNETIFEFAEPFLQHRATTSNCLCQKNHKKWPVARLVRKGITGQVFNFLHNLISLHELPKQSGDNQRTILKSENPRVFCQHVFIKLPLYPCATNEKMKKFKGQSEPKTNSDVRKADKFGRRKRELWDFFSFLE